jgi:hypothetical protein
MSSFSNQINNFGVLREALFTVLGKKEDTVQLYFEGATRGGN